MIGDRAESVDLRDFLDEVRTDFHQDFRLDVLDIGFQSRYLARMENEDKGSLAGVMTLTRLEEQVVARSRIRAPESPVRRRRDVFMIFSFWCDDRDVDSAGEEIQGAVDAARFRCRP